MNGGISTFQNDMIMEIPLHYTLFVRAFNFNFSTLIGFILIKKIAVFQIDVFIKFPFISHYFVIAHYYSIRLTIPKSFLFYVKDYSSELVLK